MAEITYSGDFDPRARYLQNGVPVYNLGGGAELNALSADLFGLDANLFGLNADVMSQYGGLNQGSGVGTFDLNASYNNGNAFAEDIAQSRYFTVTISEIRDKNGDTITFHTGGAFHDFLPVKNMSLSYTSYENLSVPLACLGGVPLLNKKRLSVIRFSCYDTDDDIIEKAVQRWEMRCFPEGKYVSYLDEVAATFQYKSYDVKGNLVFVKTLTVIPTDDVSVNRSYEENSEKLITFSLAAVGEPGASANLNMYKGFNDMFEAAPAPAGSSAVGTVNVAQSSSYDQGTPLPPYSTEVTTTTSEYDLYDSVVGRAINDRVHGTTTIDLD